MAEINHPKTKKNKTPKNAESKKTSRPARGKTSESSDEKPSKAPKVFPKKPAAKSAKAKAKKRAHVTRPTAEEIVAIAERQRDVWELKKNGASIRAIQDVFRSRGVEVSTGTIFNDIQAQIQQIQSETVEFAEQYRTLTNERVEDTIMAMFGIIKKNNSTAFEKTEAAKQINNCFKTQVEIGIIPRAVKKLEINSRSELAKLLGVAEEELPDDLGAD